MNAARARMRQSSGRPRVAYYEELGVMYQEVVP
jgi:hypothetical protein